MTTATRQPEPTFAIRVPDEDDFDGKDFLTDAVLDTLMADVISSFEVFGHIEEHGISVSVLWKRKGGKSHGSPTFAKCVKPSGLLSHFCTADFVIWIGADNVTEREWGPYELRRLLYHEARHIGWDDGDDEKDGKGPIILGHDVELFVGEVRDVGAWEHFRQVLGKDFQQSGLFGAA